MIIDRAIWDLVSRTSAPTAKLHGSGSSMHPFIQAGDVVTVEKGAPTKPVAGDVVLADLGPRGLALHRVLAVEDRVLVKGDANPEPDGWLPRSALLARAITLQRPGGPALDLTSPRQRALARALALASPFSRLLRPLASPVWRLVGHARRLAAVRSR